jgi:hypothetical protein
VLAAVRNDGLTLQWAGDQFRGDREIVATAVAQNNEAIRYASQAVRDTLIAENANRTTVTSIPANEPYPAMNTEPPSTEPPAKPPAKPPVPSLKPSDEKKIKTIKTNYPFLLQAIAGIAASCAVIALLVTGQITGVMAAVGLVGVSCITLGFFATQANKKPKIAEELPVLSPC